MNQHLHSRERIQTSARMSAVAVQSNRDRQLRRRNRLKPAQRVDAVSANDRELNYQENAMNQAVSQLEALAQGVDLTELVTQFGRLTIRELPLKFEFDSPAVYQQWPGPPVDSIGVHKQKRTLRPKLRLSERKHDRMKTSQHSETIMHDRKTTTEALASTTPVPLRQSPLRLMDLPAEVRNEIWTLLAVYDKPIEAQLRLIKLRPYQSGKTIVRRFPREPPLSAVNKQLRNEVLSLFYGMNHFTFARSNSYVLKDEDMTSIAKMQAWKPRADVVNYLTRLELRLNVCHRGVVFLIERRNSNLTVEVKASWAICSCDDRKLAMRASEHKGNLMEVAMKLAENNTRPLRGPGQWLCPKCGRSPVG